MPRQQKLKVFRTPIGFHDAYVAAPSRKAALAAWGSERDLFARGAAEQVDDPELMKEPLAHPGQVIRRSRGSAAEQIAALGKTVRGRARKADEAKQAPRRVKASQPAKPQPRPDRAPLDRAQAAIAEAEARQRKDLAELEKREAALEKERARIERRHAAETARLEQAAGRARERYESAMRGCSTAARSSAPGAGAAVGRREH